MADYINLVIEGGGVLGIAHAGALEELSARGILKGIKNYAGASAGAIIAGILACGGSSAFINKVMRKMEFSKFLDYNGKLRAVYNVLYYKGACPGDYFVNWYEDIIGKLTGGYPKITLADIKRKYGRKIVVSVVNVTRKRLEYIDYKSHPDWPLVLAVRASMSIPGIFMPVEIDNCVYIDGGVLDNYPINAFHFDGPDGDIINPRTLGLMLLSTGEMKDVHTQTDNLLHYTAAILDCMWTQPQKIHMDEQDWARTIKIPTGDMSSIDFAITAAEAATLLSAGKTAVIDFFDRQELQTAKEMRKAFFARGRMHSQHCPEDECVDVDVGVGAQVNVDVRTDLNQRSRKLTAPRKQSFSEDWDDVKEELTLLSTIKEQDSSDDDKKPHVSPSGSIAIARTPPIAIVAKPIEQFHLE
jgi:NTE family protein